MSIVGASSTSEEPASRAAVNTTNECGATPCASW